MLHFASYSMYFLPSFRCYCHQILSVYNLNLESYNYFMSHIGEKRKQQPFMPSFILTYIVIFVDVLALYGFELLSNFFYALFLIMQVSDKFPVFVYLGIS